ncbi:DUF2683 family protein [Pedobacter deserti]|uniref:DUF2683 family protein n=1 Tax=Pedobacter deserti TaxID=2817382 RepID=UPI00210D73B1|nr:DUF2683 family protein [Pedobacter sp. SYSU D00382]
MATIVVHPQKDQLKAVKAILKALKVPFEETKEETLPQHVLESIKRGQEDAKAGRTITLDQFAERMSSRL